MRFSMKKIISRTPSKKPSPAPRRARRPLLAGPSFLSCFTVFALAALATVIGVNKQVQQGRAGVIGPIAHGWVTQCGQPHNAQEPTVVTHLYGCGTKLWVVNPATGAAVLATVAGNRPAYNPANGRVADLSAAAAAAIGHRPTAVQPVVLRPARHWQDNLLAAVPLVEGLMPPLPAVPAPNARELRALALNFLGECGLNVCDTLGRVATASVVLNRAALGFDGDHTVHETVWAHRQFSWTHLNPKQVFAQENTAAGRQMKAEAQAVLTDSISGNALAVRYLLADATNYYAPDVIKTPSWGHRSGKLEVVPMPNFYEVHFKHRYMQVKTPAGRALMASLKNH